MGFNSEFKGLIGDVYFVWSLGYVSQKPPVGLPTKRATFILNKVKSCNSPLQDAIDLYS